MYSRIYLIDDVELVNLMHLVLLKSLGLEEKVISFTNPKRAMDHLQLQKGSMEPTLILLDINMPIMNGFEFLEYMVLKDLPRNIDVVIVTSSTYHQDKTLAYTFPQYVIDFVSKPLTSNKLSELVHKPFQKSQ